MAYLDWKTSTVKVNRTDHASYQCQLELVLTPEQRTELGADLAQAFGPGGSELKVDLPEKWTLYLKTKPGLSRLQLAHPQTDSWVGTIILGAEHATRLVEELTRAQSGATITVSQLGSLGSINNLELVLRLA